MCGLLVATVTITTLSVFLTAGSMAQVKAPAKSQFKAQPKAPASSPTDSQADQLSPKWLSEFNKTDKSVAAPDKPAAGTPPAKAETQLADDERRSSVPSMVALPGAVLPGNFEIKLSKIRGQESQGMMCSPDEIGMGSDHSGLLILTGKPDLGMPINKDQADVTTRASGGWKLTLPTLKDAEITFDMMYDTSDAGMIQIQKSYFTDSNIASFSSMLAFTEHVFGLPALAHRDATAYDFSSSFDFGQAHMAETKVAGEERPLALVREWINRAQSG